MKTYYLKILLIFLVLITNISKNYSQIEIVIGIQSESSGSGAAPYNNDYKSRRIQIIYSAAEINQALSDAGLTTGIQRNIIALSWDIYSNHPLNYLNNYEIKMGNTSSNNLSSHSYDANITVKNSFTFNPSGTGWQIINFDNNFEWDGTSNIIVDVCWQTSFSSTGASCWMYQDGSSEYMMRWQTSSFSNMCGGLTWYVNNIKPDLKPRVKFYFQCENIDVSVSSVPSLCNTNVINALTGNEPQSGYTGKWTVVQGTGTFNNDSQYNTSVSNVGQGTNIYRWTITKTLDGCSNYADLEVINNTPTTPNAGNDTSVCFPDFNLNANIPVYGTGQWSVVAGSGVFENSTLYNTLVSNLSGSDSGTQNVFSWTITNNGCSLSDNITITYYLPPTASVSSSSISGCFNTDVLTLNGNDPSLLNPPATGLWTVINGSGNFTNATQYNTTVTNVGSPQNIYRWTLSRNGCTSSANVVINNSSPSIATAGTDQLISDSYTSLQGNTPSVGSGVWTVNPSGPIISNPTNSNTGVTNISENILYTFTWTISNGSCPATSDEMTVVRMANITGLVIRENLTNNGEMIQTDDANFFVMIGTNKFIYGGETSNNNFTDTKLRVNGSITFDGEIDNGKFLKTQITATGSFNINNNKTYKNHLFENFGTFNLNVNSTIENSGNFKNYSNFNAAANSTLVLNGNSMQYIKSNTNGTNNILGNVVINQSLSIPSYNNGINLEDNFIINSNSVLTMNKGVVTIHENDAMLIINNPNPNAITGNFADSWIYGTAPNRALRRYLNDVVADYTFPVGDFTNPNIAILKNNNLPNGSFYIDAFFNNNPTNVNLNFPTNLSEEGLIYEQVLEKGTWVLLPNGSYDGSYDLILYHNNFGLIDPDDDNNFCILKRPWESTDGALWNFPTGSQLVQKPVNAGFAQRNSIMSFSEFSIAKNYNPLPVALVNFDYLCNEKPQLFWITASEKNNSHFTIQKSSDAINWNDVAIINGSENSNITDTYTWTDNYYSDKTYYRLLQTDYDGTLKILKTLFVSCENNELNINIYPNPFTDNLFIEIKSETNNLGFDIEISDITTKKIFTDKTYDNTTKVLFLDYLKPGIYFLKISSHKFNKTFKIEKF